VKHSVPVEDEDKHEDVTWRVMKLTSAMLPRQGRRTLIAVVTSLVLSLSVVGAPAASAATGDTWTIRTSAADTSWESVTYSAGLFVAVSSGLGSGNLVMTSPDGITWTSRTAAADSGWRSVTYGAGLFVAVASSGTGNRVMTSGTFMPAAPSKGSGSQSVAPQSVNVDIGLDAGEIPASWSGETTIGSWLSLPAPSEVSGTGDNAGNKFLGVATSEDFPVEIAQRQIDNGWGAYEIYSDDGSLLSVFIPAGYSVHVTAAPRVFAIWSTATPPAVGGQVTN
jgi:hypothetical protein